MVVGLIALSLAAARQYQSLQTSSQRLELYLQERAEFLDLFANVSMAEAAQRNFLILRDPELLRYYNLSRDRFLKNMEVIAAFPDDQLDTTPLVKRVSNDFNAERGKLERSVELGVEGRWDEAIAVVEDQMRRQTGRNILRSRLEYSNLVQARTRALLSAQREAQNLFSLFTVVLAVIAALLGLTLAWIGRNNIMRLRLSERNSMAAHAAKKRAEREQKRMEIMMREMNHRVGNSLSMVVSILGIQRAQSNEKDVKTALGAAQKRVLSIANAQRRLRFSGDLRSIDLHDLLSGVVDDIRTTQLPSGLTLDSTLAHALVLDRDAVTIALIINELVTNAIKHAFDKRDAGHILVTTDMDENGRLSLRVEDDGVGFQGDPQGFGSSVIQRLVAQFDGMVDRGRSDLGGSCTSISFKNLATTRPAPLET